MRLSDGIGDKEFKGTNGPFGSSVFLDNNADPVLEGNVSIDFLIDSSFSCKKEKICRFGSFGFSETVASCSFCFDELVAG